MSLEVGMANIIIDGKNFIVNPGKNLLENCLALGINIPHFCYHSALGSVGACRLCAVKKYRDKDDKKGRIIMSCMEPVVDGLIISVDDPEAVSFRAAVIEGLMTNHPHDCPVCDEGGECHLQDMTIMSGHTYRKYDFPKRTYKNQYLGPFINHEMNRCIQCYRCVRFYRDYAGGKDLNAFSSRNHVYFGRHEEGPLESEFSGNLAEVCPTGVFTDKTLKQHFTRKWDLTNSPSVCIHCSVGCNTIVGERYGTVRRIMNRYNGTVNGHFLCDRGRFGYEFVNDVNRIKNIEIRRGRDGERTNADEDSLRALLSGKSGRIVGIGSPRATIESNFALLKLVGKDNFYHGISKKEHRLTVHVSEYIQNSGVHTPSLKEIEEADVVLIIGEDLVNTAPMIALAVRQAARNVPNRVAEKNNIPLWNDTPVRQLGQNETSPVFIATPFKDSLDDIAEKSFRGSYGDIVSLTERMTSLFDAGVRSDNTNKAGEELVSRIASALKEAKNPLIVTGISSGEEAVIVAAMNLANAMHNAGNKVMVSFVVPESNSMGLSLFPGGSFEEIREADTLVILENDLFRRAPESAVESLFIRCKQVIAIDHLSNRTTGNADILLPAGTFAETEGTLVNNEGRAQRFYKALTTNSAARESWRWLDALHMMKEIDHLTLWNTLDEITDALSAEIPVFAPLKKYLPDADFRMLNAKIPRQTFRYSGRTAITANVNVSEPKLKDDIDSPLAFSMEGLTENPPSSLVPYYWAPGWNSVHALYKYVNEPNSSLKGGDPGIKLFDDHREEKVRQYLKYVPVKKNKGEGELLIVPAYQIFGSEELSSASQSVMKKISKPFILLNEKDAERIKVKAGDMIEFEINDVRLNIDVRTDTTLIPGVAALSAGMNSMPFVELPAVAKFHTI
jgi:NADH-quinone oxidoreductase subunit G